MEREIDITKDCKVNGFDGLEINEDGNVEMAWELWFDVDKYFGTNTLDDFSAWINFYTIWNPIANTVEPLVFLENDENSTLLDWAFTKEEEEYFRKGMEEYCKWLYGQSLHDFWFDWYSWKANGR